MGFRSKSCALGKENSHQFLCQSKWYRVIKSFEDYDGHIHPKGEEWVFVMTDVVCII
jgi:hypothetical protein